MPINYNNFKVYRKKIQYRFLSWLNYLPEAKQVLNLILSFYSLLFLFLFDIVTDTGKMVKGVVQQYPTWGF